MAVTYEGRWDGDRAKVTLSNKSFRELDQLFDNVISGSGNRKQCIELMKAAFGLSTTSSDVSWAATDLHRQMGSKLADGVEFLRCYWEGMLRLGENLEVPDQSYINQILAKNNDPFRINGSTILHDVGDLHVVQQQQDFEVKTELSKVFEIGEMLGQGAFGQVFRVTKQTRIAEFEFAIKILHPSPHIQSNNYPDRFKREIEILNRLQHRAIVQAFESGLLPDGRAYYLMPLIHGVNLRDATEGIDPRITLSYFIELCYGVEFMHERGVIHRDLKPSNVLVRQSDSQLLVLDFGCAFSFDFMDRETLTQYAIGTLAYMPHEVIRNPKHRSPGHDIYSIGVMLYECFGRELPRTENYDPLSRMRSDLEIVDQIVRTALMPEENRFRSISELRLSLMNAVHAFS